MCSRSRSDEIVELNISDLKPHPQDPFKPYPEDKLLDLSNSIEKVGLLNAIIVRPHADSGYEILAGKNRTNAVLNNGNKKIKAIIRNVDDDTAIMILTDSNLRNRETLLPSEKGWAYRMQVEAIGRQGKRADLSDSSTCAHDAHKLKSRDIVAENNNVSKDEIQRYIRLTYVLPHLLEQIDNKKIYLMAGVNFSYLDEASQKAVLEYHQEMEFKKRISVKSSMLIRSKHENNHIPVTVEMIKSIINEKKSKKSKAFSISRNRFKAYNDSLPNDKELEKLFLDFLASKFGEKI